MKNILTILLIALCLGVNAADTKKTKKEPVDTELKALTKGLKSEYDKFTKATTYALPNSMSSKQRRLCVEVVNPDEGDATIILKGWITVVYSNTPIRAQKVMAMAGDDVLELPCTEENYRFIEGRNSNFNVAMLALSGNSPSRPPDREEIKDTEANPKVAEIIKRLAQTEKGEKVEIRFAGQQSNQDFKMEERDRALFAQMLALRDYLNSQKSKPEERKEAK